MTVEVFKTEDAPTRFPDGRPRLFQVIRRPDGTLQLLVHPSRWDEYVEAVAAKVPVEERHPEVRELIAMAKANAC